MRGRRQHAVAQTRSRPGDLRPSHPTPSAAEQKKLIPNQGRPKRQIDHSSAHPAGGKKLRASSFITELEDGSMAHCAGLCDDVHAAANGASQLR
jgi:hypothetical protein